MSSVNKHYASDSGTPLGVQISLNSLL